MTMRRIAGLRAMTAVVMVAALAAGCGNSDDTTSSGAAVDAALTTTTTATPVGGPPTTEARQACSAVTLGAAALGSFEAPEIIDVVCEQEYATATLVNGPGGENLLLFTLQNGAWSLAANGPIADLAAVAAPNPFSTTAIPSWQRLREARIARANRPPSDGPSGDDAGGPTSTRVNPDTGNLDICVKDGDFEQCTPATTTPPPPVPEDPDAPEDETPRSSFCRFNYNDPACVADPGYTP